ncbi:MAG: methyltransferase family protein [Candidatus Thorarchaeota archaeon]
MIEYVIIILASTLFGIQHSGLSALRVKGRIISKWGKSGYARIFSITSLITLLLAFLSMNFGDWFYFITQPTQINLLLFIPGIILAIAGIVLALMASKVISVSTVADMRPHRKAELVTDGIYSRIRHPLYLAVVMIFSSIALIYPFSTVIVFSLSMIGYTMIGAYLEERKLVKYYGEAYLEYKRTAGFIIPKLRQT